MISREINVIGNLVGTYNDLAELMELNHQGKVHIAAERFSLADVVDVMHQLDEGKIEGRAVLIPALPTASKPTVKEVASVLA
jgi:D-arabinose 1-dehydrogenase-like Zn-dependent alcohol dehydrogenase